ncbi:MAG: hypothetical protein ABI867_00845 [Kofleriaceae bacterium]
MRWIIAIACIVAVPRVAAGDRDAGKRAAAAAEANIAKKEFAAAATQFREAFVADPRAEYLCNVGVAYYKAVELPRAQRYLAECLVIGTGLDPTFLKRVRTVLAAVETKLAAGAFTAVDFALDPPSTTIAIEGGVPYDEPIVGSRRVWFPRARYRVTLHAEGRADQQLELDATTGAPIDLRAALVVAPVVAPTPEPIVQEPAPIRDQAPEPRRRSRRPAILATAGTLAVGLAAGGLYVMANHQVTKAEATADPDEFARLSRSSRSYLHTAWIAGGLAGVGAVVSGVLWLRTRSTGPVGLSASASSAMVTWTAPF